MKKRKFVEFYYDPGQSDWNVVIEAELKRRGLRRGRVTVICRPFKRVKSGGCDGIQLIDESNLHKKVAKVSAPSGRV
jgi:hypothetical protein